MLHPTGIPESLWFYWWRAQTAAYLIKPNSRVLAEVAVRKKILMDGTHDAEGLSSCGETFPNNMISVHIRKGDKWKEAELKEDKEFLVKAEQLVQANPTLKRKIFLSSEDPNSIDYFRANKTWETVYVVVDREDFRQKTDMTPLQHGYNIGVANEMINSVLNLDLAVECDAFVGQFNSNWVRLIDELRATTRCKANLPYMDVDQERIENYFD